MPRKLPLRMLLFLLAIAATGCPRHVVRAPEEVERLNDRDWTVLKEPRSAGETPASLP